MSEYKRIVLPDSLVILHQLKKKRAEACTSHLKAYNSSLGIRGPSADQVAVNFI